MPTPILSPRKRAVAILAESGLTNREIGRELGITPGTVTYTLHAVYHSLGIQPGAGRRHLRRALVAQALGLAGTWRADRR
jgi:DNA-binding NarL/FixJ family response regulator